jgi:hypothetical protein
MSETQEQVWQPAVIREAHPILARNWPHFYEGVKHIFGKKVRVRRTENWQAMSCRKSVGLDCQELFEVMPNDIDGEFAVFCEHEILTD